MTRILRAVHSFSCEVDGHIYDVPEGATVREGHPLQVAQPSMFAPIRVDFEVDGVEQATAAPGEVRRVGRPKGSTNKPKPTA